MSDKKFARLNNKVWIIVYLAWAITIKVIEGPSWITTVCIFSAVLYTLAHLVMDLLGGYNE